MNKREVNTNGLKEKQNKSKNNYNESIKCVDAVVVVVDDIEFEI